MTKNTETTHWEHAAWLCPRCGNDEDGPSRLQLVDSRDTSIDSRDVWGGEYDADLYERQQATTPAVACPDCETIFDVEFVSRDEDDDE